MFIHTTLVILAQEAASFPRSHSTHAQLPSNGFGGMPVSGHCLASYRKVSNSAKCSEGFCAGKLPSLKTWTEICVVQSVKIDLQFPFLPSDFRSVKFHNATQNIFFASLHSITFENINQASDNH